ncbi:hypothetical protein GCM10010401_17690 [Rarobacter faecitabidus]|uniref:ABC-2 type transport system permease protein n=1 Tax=Rarobacter faecitabidus TaxID=13243 RepID=A0A542ZUW6_RARFA|nr:hypothetical protein [Rarobacter faecitabidus]TQL63980.1 ABC-2 type transport system permease protein [Rarobacter faecitabidus]
MVDVLVRLKLALLANAFRRSAWQVVGIVLALVYGMALVGAQLATIPLLARQDPEFIESTWVIAGALAVIGWMAVPIVSMGADMTLDPRRFAVFGVSPARLMPGLAIATVVGVPGIVTVVLALANSRIWRQYQGMVPVAFVCAILGVAMCVVGSRVSTIWVGRYLSSRAARWIIAAMVGIPVIAVASLISTRRSNGPLQFDATIAPAIGDVLAWTPFGAPWGVTVAIARKDWAQAAALSGITIASLAVLLWLWWLGLRAVMEDPSETRTEVRSSALSGLWRTRGALGAITARCLTYWLRDARYAAGLAMVPIIPLLFYVATGGGGLAMLALGPSIVFLIMWSISADVGYDGSAFWLHLATGVSGAIDRGGRVLAAALLAVPLGVLATIGSLWSTGRWDLTPAAFALTLGTAAAAGGLASVLSAVFVYPVPAAGENPFSAPSGTSAVNLVTQLVGWAALTAISAPFLGTAIIAILRDVEWLGWLSLLLAGVVGGLVLLLGVRLGGRLIDRGGPDLYAKTVAIR